MSLHFVTALNRSVSGCKTTQKKMKSLSLVHRHKKVSSVTFKTKYMNAPAQDLTKNRKYDHISPVLRSLHWLPVAQRIDFKAALFVYKSLHGLAPKYISDVMVSYEPSWTLRSSGQKVRN